MAKKTIVRPGFIIVEVKFKDKNYKLDKKSTVIPPSDYFVVDGNNTELKKGAQVIFGSAVRLSPLFRDKNQYVINEQDVIATIE